MPIGVQKAPGDFPVCGVKQKRDDLVAGRLA